jgi:hypothetical protein
VILLICGKDTLKYRDIIFIFNKLKYFLKIG